jgi:hypothetical protein
MKKLTHAVLYRDSMESNIDTSNRELYHSSNLFSVEYFMYETHLVENIFAGKNFVAAICMMNIRSQKTQFFIGHVFIF